MQPTADQTQEIIKCVRDPLYFIENHCYIVSEGKKRQFKLYDYQRRMLRTYASYDRVITMIGRQSGKTQTAAAFILWWAIFKPDQTIMVSSNVGESATEIIYRMKQMYYEVENWLKPEMTSDNVKSVIFDNNSRVISSATTPNTGRGKSPDLFYIDELAAVNPTIQSAMWASVQPTLSSTKGTMIITSTPNTDEDLFSQLWFSAVDAPLSKTWTNDQLEKIGIETDKLKNDNNHETVYESDPNNRYQMEEEGFNNTSTETFGFKRFFAHWSEKPGRDEQFKQRQIAELGSYSKWLTEFECVFASSDVTLVDPVALVKINAFVRKPIYIDKHGVRWYEEITPNTAYGVILDPAEGNGGDNSVIQVWSIPDMVQIAEWARNDKDYIDQTRQLIRVIQTIDEDLQNDDDHMGESRIYYSAECNGIGAAINVLLEQEEDLIPGYFMDSDSNKRRGILMTERSKREYCLRLKSLIERGLFVPYSKHLISELKNFIRKGKRYEAKAGSKDDRVMSCVLMCAMLDEVLHQEDDLEVLLKPKIIEDDSEYEEADEDEPIGFL